MAKSKLAQEKAAERVRQAQRARLAKMMANAGEGAQEAAQRKTRQVAQRELLIKLLAAAILPPPVPPLLPTGWQPVQPAPSLTSLRPRPASGRPRQAAQLVSSSAESTVFMF